jgi:hypothetical protein
VIVLQNLFVKIESKIQDHNLHLNINSKTLVLVELYNGFSHIVEFKITLWPLRVKRDGAIGF